jgi:hypothetical protein
MIIGQTKTFVKTPVICPPFPTFNILTVFDASQRVDAHLSWSELIVKCLDWVSKPGTKVFHIGAGGGTLIHTTALSLCGASRRMHEVHRDHVELLVWLTYCISPMAHCVQHFVPRAVGHELDSLGSRIMKGPQAFPPLYHKQASPTLTNCATCQLTRPSALQNFQISTVYIPGCLTIGPTISI